MVSDNQRSELPPLIPSTPRTSCPEDMNQVDKGAQLPLDSSQLREALTNYYAHFNSDRLRHLDKIVAKYADNQEELSRSLQQKYGKCITEFVPRESAAADAQQQDEDPEQQDEDEHLIDYVRIYPLLQTPSGISTRRCWRHHKSTSTSCSSGFPRHCSTAARKQIATAWCCHP